MYLLEKFPTHCPVNDGVTNAGSLLYCLYLRLSKEDRDVAVLGWKHSCAIMIGALPSVLLDLAAHFVDSLDLIPSRNYSELFLPASGQPGEVMDWKFLIILGFGVAKVFRSSFALHLYIQSFSVLFFAELVI